MFGVFSFLAWVLVPQMFSLCGKSAVARRLSWLQRHAAHQKAEVLVPVRARA